MTSGSAISDTKQFQVAATADLPEYCDRQQSWRTRLLQNLVIGRLSRIEGGRLQLNDHCQQVVLGTAAHDNLSVAVQVHDNEFYRQIALHGAPGAAASYIDGHWDCQDLPTLFRIFSRNLSSSAGIRSSMMSRILSSVGHWSSRNTRAGSRRNIHAHYDLGNDFFRLFLDESMMYSSAVYETPDMTLEEAQNCRLERVCRELELTASDHLLEIGTGWGGFAIYAARNYGCHVTTTTISDQQYVYAKARIEAAGLSEQITLLKQDYRDVSGQFTKLVSLEMIEAVGPQFHDTFFASCNSLLRPGGRMLLQAIVIPDQRYRSYLQSVDFIQKYIFPGGSLPSVQALQASVSRTSQLRLLSLNDYADSYARTLREWRRRFHERIDDIQALGYPSRFLRMWDYYFAYCEGAFDERAVGVVHAVWGA